MAERESICLRCFHSYVCEQFNEHRDVKNDKCHFYNDHFVPYADVAQVRRGRWLWNETGELGWEQYYICSNCGDNEYWESKFCPNCGAKMDLEE